MKVRVLAILSRTIEVQRTQRFFDARKKMICAGPYTVHSVERNSCVFFSLLVCDWHGILDETFTCRQKPLCTLMQRVVAKEAKEGHQGHEVENVVPDRESIHLEPLQVRLSVRRRAGQQMNKLHDVIARGLVEGVEPLGSVVLAAAEAQPAELVLHHGREGVPEEGQVLQPAKPHRERLEVEEESAQQ